MGAATVAGALIGAIGGALGGLLGALLEKLFSGGKREGKRNLGVTIGVIAAITITNLSGLRERLVQVIDPPSRTEQLGHQLLSIPGVRERVRGKPPQEAQAIAKQLAVAGLQKLDSATLVQRVTLVSALLANADDQVCAGFAVGKTSGDDLNLMLATFTDEQRNLWFGLIHSAVEAEMGLAPGAAPVTPTPDAIAAAIAELQLQLPDANRERFLHNLGMLPQLPPAESCWTIRSLYTLVDGATGPTQAIAARALVMP